MLHTRIYRCDRTGITATTTMSGANADADKTDWSQLKGKHIVIWPDNDEPGKQYAENATTKLLSLGIASLSIVKIPEGKPKGWDAADYVQENTNVSDFIENNLKKVIIRPPLNILDWSADRFVGPVPEQKFRFCRIYKSWYVTFVGK